MKIAIDFDGVIHEYSKGWSDGTIYDPPVAGVKEALDALKASGHYLMIFTTRTNKIFRKKEGDDQEKVMKEWLVKHEIPFDKIWTFGKPMADIFVDDRAIQFRGKWEETINEVNNFTVWNKSKEE